jgi:photosystem II stability/assembly factor-like uncharacterized protein
MNKIIPVLIVIVSVILTGCSNKEKNISNGNGGVYKSTNGGEVFHLSSKVSTEKNLSGASIFDLAISPLDSKVIYAGTAKHGIYRSNNAGETWAESKSDFTLVRKIVLDPRDKNIIYIVAELKGERALFKTIDAGINWTKLLAQRDKNTPLTIDLAIDYNNPKILYATDSTGGVFKSEDGGKKWKSILWTKSPVQKILLDAKNSQKVYFITVNNDVLISNDGGETFENKEGSGRIIANPTQVKDITVHNRAKKDYSRIYSVAISPTEQNVLYVLAESGLSITRDGGKTYQKIKTLLREGSTIAHKIVVDPIDANILYLVAGKIIYKSIDKGNTWEVIPVKISWPVKSFVISPDNSSDIYIGLSKPIKPKSSLFPF